MQSRFINSLIFSKEKAESLKKLRIIQKNLIHVQGIPRSLANVGTLRKKSYFGQYGIIKDIMLSIKISDDNKENYSVYITYENEIQLLVLFYVLIQLLYLEKFFGCFLAQQDIAATF